VHLATPTPTRARSCVIHAVSQSTKSTATCRCVIGENWVNVDVPAGQAFCVGGISSDSKQLI